jgi:outer membrane protein assembly factor BamB
MVSAVTTFILTLVLGVHALSLAAPQAPSSPTALSEELWDAARAGEAARVSRALDQGAEVNAKSRYGATALIFAADKGHLDIVKLLLDRGADANLQDTFYRFRALDMALMNNHTPVGVLLLERGSKGAGSALITGIRNGNLPLVHAALASPDLTAENIKSAVVVASKSGNAEIAALVDKKLAALPPEAAAAISIERTVLQSYAGTYRNESTAFTLTFALSGDQLTVSMQGQQPRPLVATTPATFRFPGVEGVSFTFAGRGGATERVVVDQNGQTQALARMTTPPADATGGTPPPAAAANADPPSPPPARTAARPWPGFRGANAAGNGDGQGAVAEWNVEDGQNVRWKTAIPGISNASPIVWGNRVFVTTAVSSAGDKTFRTGLYGDVAPVNDLSEHTWKIYCLDKATGKILWERTAYTGLPKVKRHTKASQANSTPVTDGTRVVALFGSIGMLAAWDMNGKPLWKADVGVLDSGWFFDPTYQWGHSSSPIIHDGKVIIQADRQKDSYIAAYDSKDGKQVWRTARDEISTWGTPTLFTAGNRTQIVTNGTKVRGYDPATGALLWTLGPNSEVTVGTPVVGDGLVYVTGGYPPVRPIYAIKPTASGEITMAKDQTSNEAVAWSNSSGTYIPTPLFYQGILYTCGNEGIITAYDARTGERLYRARAGGGGSFSASPVAADGRLYLANEDGDVIVARAGRSYQELAKNEMNEVIMSTPAISGGLVIVRTIGHIYGLGDKER